MMRKLCKTCKKRPVAINYYKNKKAYYRSQCDHCSRKRKDGIPKWVKAGYKKKLKCDKCGFSSKYPEQFEVFFIDDNQNNCRFSNLKTVCANCQRLLQSETGQWKQGGLTPDF